MITKIIYATFLSACSVLATADQSLDGLPRKKDGSPREMTKASSSPRIAVNYEVKPDSLFDLNKKPRKKVHT